MVSAGASGDAYDQIRDFACRSQNDLARRRQRRTRAEGELARSRFCTIGGMLCSTGREASITRAGGDPAREDVQSAERGRLLQM